MPNRITPGSPVASGQTRKLKLASKLLTHTPVLQRANVHRFASAHMRLAPLTDEGPSVRATRSEGQDAPSSKAASADEALILLQHDKIIVDVVFSDIEMPGSMDGFGLSKWVRVNRPGVDVLLVGNVPRAVKAAADLCDSGSLPKPYEPQLAVERIKQLLALRAAKEEK